MKAKEIPAHLAAWWAVLPPETQRLYATGVLALVVGFVLGYWAG